MRWPDTHEKRPFENEKKEEVIMRMAVKSWWPSISNTTIIPRRKQ